MFGAGGVDTNDDASDDGDVDEEVLIATAEAVCTPVLALLGVHCYETG